MAALEPGYHLGDALELLPKVQPESVDLVFTSPPAIVETPFGEGKKREFDPYHELLREACALMARIIKPKGFIAISATDPRHKGRLVANHILCTHAMQELGLGRMHHKILVRDSIQTIDLYKPNYQHVLVFTRKGWVYKHQRFEGQPVWPQGFVRRVAGILTASGELVADPFAGRGPVLYGCKRLGRKCIAIELDPDVYNPDFEGLD